MDKVKRVQDLVAERHMTLYQLTQVSGISDSTLRSTRRRGGQLTVDTIERICDALDITLSEFFAKQGCRSVSSAKDGRLP
jgi:DNA-binding Xre family transcriptional regulator